MGWDSILLNFWEGWVRVIFEVIFGFMFGWLRSLLGGCVLEFWVLTRRVVVADVIDCNGK